MKVPCPRLDECNKCYEPLILGLTLCGTWFLGLIKHLSILFSIVMKKIFGLIFMGLHLTIIG
jgi:hypothetical protein